MRLKCLKYGEIVWRAGGNRYFFKNLMLQLFCNFAVLQNRVIASGNRGGKSGQHKAAHYLTGRSRLREQKVPQKMTASG